MLLIETMTTPKIMLGYGIINELRINNYIDYFTEQEAINYDLLYYKHKSGLKPISKTYKDLTTNMGLVIDNDYNYVTHNDNRVIISPERPLYYLATIIGNKYKDKWSKTYQTLSIKYNPNDNFNVTTTNKQTLSETSNTNDVITEESKQKTKITETSNNNSKDSAYGFNSQTSVPTDDSNITSTTTTEGSIDDNIKNLSGTKSGTNTKQHTINQEHIIKGIKDITNQQLIEEEIRLRKNNIISEIIMKDIDTIITLKIY